MRSGEPAARALPLPRGFGGLSPYRQSSKAPKLKYETLNQWNFLSNLNVKPLLHKLKTPLITALWRRFWARVNN